MAALVPPPNAEGIPLPPLPANPALIVDIPNAKEYVDRLSASKASNYAAHATDDEMGEAETFKASVVFSHAPGGNAVPPWLAALNAAVQQVAVDVAYLRTKADELPILLANAGRNLRSPL